MTQEWTKLVVAQEWRAEWLYHRLLEKVSTLNDDRVKVGMMKGPVDYVFGHAMEAGSRKCSPDRDVLVEEIFEEIKKDIKELEQAGWDVSVDGHYIIAPYLTMLEAPIPIVRYGKTVSPQMAWKLRERLEDGALRRHYYGDAKKTQ